MLNQAGSQSPAFPGFSVTNAAVQMHGSNDHVFNNSLPFSNNTSYTAEGWVNNTRANNAQAIIGYVLSRFISTVHFRRLNPVMAVNSSRAMPGAGAAVLR